VIATPVAPVVDQFNVLLPPTLILAELAVKELITGKACTTTVTVAFTEPAALLAVSV
jgi:hypothetical protein